MQHVWVAFVYSKHMVPFGHSNTVKCIRLCRSDLIPGPEIGTGSRYGQLAHFILLMYTDYLGDEHVT